MKSPLFKLLTLALALAASVAAVSAQSVIKVAAAANLRYSLSEIEKIYETKFTDVDIQVNYGGSGTLYGQIINGAPFDLFLSADDILPSKLKEEGITAAESRTYACGKLALYSLREGLNELGMRVLEAEDLGRIAVANPRIAPYGARSVEILKALGLWEKLERKIAYGDSIAQAAQATMTGNCDVGFVALSLLLNPEVELKGSYYTIPEESYEPIAQAGIVVKEGEATKFFEFMLSDECRAVWDKYGYSTTK